MRLVAMIVLLLSGLGCASEPPQPPAFESISYVKSGGFAGIHQRLDVDARGRVSVDGRQVAQLDETFAALKRDAARVPWQKVQGRHATQGAADLFVYELQYVTRQGDDDPQTQVVSMDEMKLRKAPEPLQVLVKSLEAMYHEQRQRMNDSEEKSRPQETSSSGATGP